MTHAGAGALPHDTSGTRSLRRRAPLAGLALLLGAAALLTALPSRGTVRPATDQAASPTSCQQVRFGACRALALPDGSTVRYAVLRPDGAADSETDKPVPAVLLDQGGPGVATFGNQWPGDIVRQTLSPRIAAYPLLVLEEPWVTAEYSAPCQAAASALFTTLHAGQEPADAASLDHACDLFVADQHWGWEPAAYQRAVSAIARAEHLRVEGFVGLSFGGRRLGYLTQTPPDWAVLVNPAPARATAAAYVSGRRQASLAGLAARCGRCDDAGTALTRLAARGAGLRAGPVGVEGRSVELTEPDVGAAFFALGYQQRADLSALSQAVLEGGADADRATGALADGVWARFGSDSVSPSFLAYLAEVCPAYPGWNRLPRGAASPLDRFLALYHSACLATPPTAVDRYAAPTAPGQRLCVTGTTGDPVAPAGAARSWQRPGAVVLAQRTGAEHGSWAGTRDCVDRLDVSTQKGTSAW